MIRREAFEDIGGFDPAFHPAWYEDVDFCRRLKARGWEIYFAPYAEFFHEGGYSAEVLGKQAFMEVYYRNQIRYARKHFRRMAVVAVKASIVAGMLARMVARPRDVMAHAKVLWGAFARW